ncbi:zinc metalloproteinase nas-13-like [Stegodyphus dumicola]|uniref:zinc metalloproteinase nas-13-like n=1 Tax=Stegodyphus dumicola TaxID=202533 RepID=UPI0015B14D8D|nr:zinc metalloproteinase nas-13-like [Stegodyphus dumicola]
MAERNEVLTNQEIPKDIIDTEENNINNMVDANLDGVMRDISGGFNDYVLDEMAHENGVIKIRIMQSLEFRSAVSNSERYWEDGVVPYELSPTYNESEIGIISDAIEEFRNRTCIRFVPRKDELTYIFIEPDSGCSSIVGMIRERSNNVSLSTGCYLKGTVLHELMHVIGFIHEQNRPDRDDFVKIFWDNIIEDAKLNFEKYAWDQVHNFSSGYDYGSVMHYGAYAFAINDSLPTIEPLKKGVEIGQRDNFSDLDVIKINSLYNCSQEKKDFPKIPIKPLKTDRKQLKKIRAFSSEILRMLMHHFLEIGKSFKYLFRKLLKLF